MTIPDIFELEKQHASGLYAKREIALVRGEGARLWDSTGKVYIDCDSGHGVANLGHARPEVARAIAEQATRLVTCFESYYNDQRAALVDRLTRLTPGLTRIYLCNSGTESVEAGLKLARYTTGRAKVVAAMRGFHGRTMGALSATWNKNYRQPFEPLVPGFTHIPYNNVEALEGAVDGDTAAVLLEAVQGEGGVHVGEAAFLLRAQALCHQHGAMLIIDEVQSGFGRTGKMFAYQHTEGLAPDFLCVAKSIAGGVPMGATLIGPRVKELTPGLHSSTFGGNPLACAAAVAALEVFERENLAAQAAEKGAYLLKRLAQIQSPLIREVRGLGLMIGVELKQKVAPYLKLLTEKGVLALPAGLTVLRFLPPLVITRPELEQVASVVEEALKQTLKEP
jgi:acetylornithine/LysW-gamma-L-lysine aminotransferase